MQVFRVVCYMEALFPLSCAVAKTRRAQAALLCAALLVILCAKSTCLRFCARRSNLQPSARLLHRGSIVSSLSPMSIRCLMPSGPLTSFQSSVMQSNYLVKCSVFRLDGLASSVIATATWLGGWVAGWLSHSGIVSKPLNLSENFFDRLKAPSFYFF